jgi:hypothetical protein
MGGGSDLDGGIDQTVGKPMGAVIGLGADSIQNGFQTAYNGATSHCGDN